MESKGEQDGLDDPLIAENSQDLSIQSLQYSTRALIGSFRDKTKMISTCSNDIKKLLREGYDVNVARSIAEKFFGQTKISFIAIDGTESQDQQLDMLLFYVGAFAYTGQLEFGAKKCECGDVTEADRISNISTAIPLYEEDASSIIGKKTEAGTEVDTEHLPSILMQFAEYYLAVKLLQDNPDLKVVIMDRTLAGDVGHLIWSVGQFIKEKKCLLQGIHTDFGVVSSLDLELARILHPNAKLGIPAPRSQFIKYSAMNHLLFSIKEDDKARLLDYDSLLKKIGGKSSRLSKLVKDISSFNEDYSFFENKPDDKSISVNPELKQYWERVFSATMSIARHIFETPHGEHPLKYEESLTKLGEVTEGTNKVKKWITSSRY